MPEPLFIGQAIDLSGSSVPPKLQLAQQQVAEFHIAVKDGVQPADYGRDVAGYGLNVG
jgi:hypothetical protein